MHVDGIHQWGDGFYVCFSIPEVYFDWFTLYNKLRSDGYDIICVTNPANPYKPFAYIKFETLVEALEFKMVNM